MEKQHRSQLAKSKFYKNLIPGLFMPIYISRANCQFIKILKRLLLYLGLDQYLYSITPTLHYSRQYGRHRILSIKQLPKVTLQYDSSGIYHAPI